MIEGLSINGLWPAGLPLALGVVLLTILAVRMLPGGARRATPGRGEHRTQGPDHPTDSRQVLEESYTRGELTTEDCRERLLALSRGT